MANLRVSHSKLRVFLDRDFGLNMMGSFTRLCRCLSVDILDEVLLIQIGVLMGLLRSC